MRIHFISFLIGPIGDINSKILYDFYRYIWIFTHLSK